MMAHNLLGPPLGSFVDTLVEPKGRWSSALGSHKGAREEDPNGGDHEVIDSRFGKPFGSLFGSHVGSLFETSRSCNLRQPFNGI